MAKPIARRNVRAQKTTRRSRSKGRKAASGAAHEAGLEPSTELETDESQATEEVADDPRRDAYGQYLRDMNRLDVELLTPQEELKLGRKIKGHIRRAVDAMLVDLEEAAKLVKARRTDPLERMRARRCIARLNPDDLKGKALRKSLLERMGTTEVEELYEMYADEEGKRLRDDFVKANLKLAISMTRRFDTGSMSFADLVQEGNIGLMHAVLRYDYRRGFRFSTYAGWWIRHQIGRAIADKARTIRIPVHMTEFVALVRSVRLELTGELGRKPDDVEVVARLRRGDAKSERIPKTDNNETLLEKVRRLDRNPVLQFSLDQPARTDDGDGDTMHDLMPDEIEDLRESATIIPHADLEVLRRAMTRLKPIEIDVLRQRFGIGDDEERTFKEIGDKYGLSRERIRQLQNHALEKLKRDKELAPLRRELRD